ncbi:MAG: DUF2264 domain-containing protein, partial [Planctomycetota bacterium]
MTTRTNWLNLLERLARPPLAALAAGRLKATMPIYGPALKGCTYLEGVARTLVGIAPWLEGSGGDAREVALRTEFRELVRRGLIEAVRPGGADHLGFDQAPQGVVDTAFLAQAILRAPHALLDGLDATVRRQLLEAMMSSRKHKPAFCNWLLFSATTEVVIGKLGGEADPMRIDYALKLHDQWHKGDGMYGDGPSFHWDYYNSYVIQPMLIDVHAAVAGREADWDKLRPEMLRRATRWAFIQERMIAPDGTFPVIGRSIAYRCGAFQSLAQAALLGMLPEGLSAGQTRCALDAVIRRTLDTPKTWDAAGWLKIGLCGDQPSLGESYIRTGSSYLCSTAVLPLGLQPEHPFWSEPDQTWSSQR